MARLRLLEPLWPLLYLLLLLLPSCGHDGNPVGPPSPPPSTAPSPPPPRLMELGEVGLGAVVCCASGGAVDEGLRDGWPLITEEAAERFRAAGVQITHLRTEPGNPAVMGKLAETVAMLKRKGIRAEVTLIDGWLLRHNETPWGEGCEVTRGAPGFHHLEHVRETVRAAGPDAWFDIGNEIGLCRPHYLWYEGIANAARQAGAKVVGGDSDYDFLDYFNYHGFHVQQAGGKPSWLNETDNQDYSPDSWEALLRQGQAAGVTIMYWPGPNDDTERAAVLDRIRRIRSGEPPLCPVPSSCPRLNRIGVKLHQRLGDTCVWDATGRFGEGNGHPCNDEHHEVCGSSCGSWRRCEDPRGPVWEGARPLANPYLAKAPCSQPVRACPREPWLDVYGQEVDTSRAQCSAWQQGS